MEMENTDRAIATVSGLQVGTHHFQLTVTDRQGLSSTATLTVVVRKGESWHGGGRWGSFCFLSHRALGHTTIIQKYWCLSVHSRPWTQVGQEKAILAVYTFAVLSPSTKKQHFLFLLLSVLSRGCLFFL